MADVWLHLPITQNNQIEFGAPKQMRFTFVTRIMLISNP
jgi:hypothetical protein